MEVVFCKECARPLSHCLAGERGSRETTGKQCTVTTGPSDRDISLQRLDDEDDLDKGITFMFWDGRPL